MRVKSARTDGSNNKYVFNFFVIDENDYEGINVYVFFGRNIGDS